MNYISEKKIISIYVDNFNIQQQNLQPYFDPFHLILFLLRLERQLDEELLQFLIAVVDAKLLKAETDECYSLHLCL